MSIYKQLFEGLEGIEGFDPVKAETLIEAHVATQVQEALDEANTAHEAEVAQLKEKANQYGDARYQEALEESASLIDTHMSNYMNEWAETNSAAIDSQIRVELAESMLSDLVNVVKVHNVVVPEGTDVLAESEKQATELREALDAEIARSHELENASKAALREAAILRAGVGLTNTEVDQLTSLSESFEFDDKFEGRLTTLRESALGVQPEADPEPQPDQSALNENGELLDDEPQPEPGRKPEAVNEGMKDVMRFLKPRT
jgi:hypothetical protein